MKISQQEMGSLARRAGDYRLCRFYVTRIETYRPSCYCVQIGLRLYAQGRIPEQVLETSNQLLAEQVGLG